jgi:hypothetical protein
VLQFPTSGTTRALGTVEIRVGKPKERCRMPLEVRRRRFPPP